MKKDALLATLLIAGMLLVVSAQAQILQPFAFVQPNGSPTDASAFVSNLSARQQARIFIIPTRLADEPASFYPPDLVSYSVVFQLSQNDTDGCHRSASFASMPPVRTCVNGACRTLGSFYATGYQTATDAKAAYDALDPFVKATAILLTTAASNNPYLLVMQSIGVYLP